MLLILVPYFLFTTGAIYEVFGIHTTLILSSKAPSYNYEIIHETEIQAAKWLRLHKEDDYQIYRVDRFRTQILVSQGQISPRLVDRSSFLAHRKMSGYIWLGYGNVVNRELVTNNYGILPLEKFNGNFVGKNKVYANGGVEVWQ